MVAAAGISGSSTAGRDCARRDREPDRHIDQDHEADRDKQPEHLLAYGLEPRMNRTIRLATEAKRSTTSPRMRSLRSLPKGATKEDEALLGRWADEHVAKSRSAEGQPAQLAHRRLNGFPDGNSCKTNAAGSRTRLRPGEHEDRHEQPHGTLAMRVRGRRS